MLAEVGEKSIVVGGKVDVEDRYVEPTVVKGEYVVVGVVVVVVVVVVGVILDSVCMLLICMYSALILSICICITQLIHHIKTNGKKSPFIYENLINPSYNPGFNCFLYRCVPDQQDHD